MKPLPHEASTIRDRYEQVCRLLEQSDVEAADRLIREFDTADPVRTDSPMIGEWVLLRARVARANGSFQDAVRDARAALNAFQITSADDRLAETHRILGGAYLGLGVTKSARVHTRDALAIYRRLNDSAGCMLATNDLAHVHFVRGEYELAVDHLSDAIALARQTGAQNKETAFVGNLGRIYLMQGHWSKAEQALLQAYERARSANLEASSARNLLSLGYLSVLKHDFELAAERLDNALVLIEHAGLTRERAIHYEYSGWWHFEQQHWIQAKEDFRFALDIGRRMSLENDLVSQSMRGLAECEAALGDWSEAERLADDGLAIALEVDERAEVGCLYRVLAEAQANQGNAQTAEISLDRAQKILATAGDPYELARLAVVEARIARLVDSQTSVRIIESLESALQLYSKLGATHQVTEVRRLMVDAYRQNGDLERAIQTARTVLRGTVNSSATDISHDQDMITQLSMECERHSQSGDNEFRLGGMPWLSHETESGDELQSALDFFVRRINADRALLIEVTAEGRRSGRVLASVGADDAFKDRLGRLAANTYQRDLVTERPRFHWAVFPNSQLAAHLGDPGGTIPTTVMSVPAELGPESTGLLYADCLPGRVAEESHEFGPRDFEFAVAFAEVVSWRSIKLRSEGLFRDVQRLRDQLAHSCEFPSIITRNSALRETLARARMIVDANVSVLIQGETGTGKDLLARAIHFSSRRRDHRFVSVNCAALPESLLESELFGVRRGAFTGADRDKAGLFEEADGGTFFLDEIGEMPLSLQVKLLRLLESKELTRLGDTKPRIVDVRVISATNRDLSGEMDQKTFRQDLYYRLAPVTFTLPPLRERREDIPLLIEHSLKTVMGETNREVRLASETVRMMCAYHWPGNVRELENEVRKLVLLAPSSGDIPPECLAGKFTDEHVPNPGDDEQVFPEHFSLYNHMADIERRFIARALTDTGGVKKHAAVRLGMPESTLRLKMKQYDLEL